jgi:magnesium chelatase family protein
VLQARAIQSERFKGDKIFANAAMSSRQIRRHCRIDADSEKMLESAMLRQGLSARAYDRILKVSRTIADLANREDIISGDIAEAIGYRSLDRTYWA